MDAETAALVSARRTLEIANNRYRAGLVTYLEVATAQSAELDRERQVVRLKAERLTASATLAKAVEIAETKLPKLDSGDLGVGWRWLDWIIAHALMREAKALIQSPP